MREHQRLNRESQARTQDTATLERSIATNQASLQTFLDAREERIDNEIELDKEILRIRGKIDKEDGATPEQQAQINQRRSQIRLRIMEEQNVDINGAISESSIGATIERLNEQLRKQQAELERRIGASANTGTAQSSGAVSPK
jgi:peptidoglycan hydrolase CwlO-like protein